MIDLQGLTKLYGTVIGVNDISMSLPPGGYGLLGPNGSGKSTLLNLITGQLTPTIGSVRVFGESPYNNTKLFRRLGYCPGSEGLYANVSSLDWVSYLTQLHGFSSQEARQRAIKNLEIVGLKDAMKSPIATYSRGMRQRTKLAQALAHEPDFLILDEPFNGLDPVGRHEMTEILRDWLELGKSLLLASHILHEVEAITNSFLLICGGRLLASGTSEEVNALMVDVPNEVVVDCNQPRAVGEALARLPDTVSVTYKSSERVAVSTNSAGQLYNVLTELGAQSGIEINRVKSTDESLQTLFNSLMRIHRGEL